MLETVEQQTRTRPVWSIIWLHGLGADGHDFAPIVPELLRPDWPAIRFVFPHAPVRPVTINGGVPMRAWYDISNLSLEQRADEAGLRESIAEVEALIARERDRGVPPSRVILVGFSQGGAVALAAGLRREAGVAGIASLSGYLPLGAQTPAEITSAGRATPVFLAHGSQDPVVAASDGQAFAGGARGARREGRMARLSDAAQRLRGRSPGPGRLADGAFRGRLTHTSAMADVERRPWFPDFCRLPRIAAVLAIAELVVLIIGLAPSHRPPWTARRIPGRQRLRALAGADHRHRLLQVPPG